MTSLTWSAHWPQQSSTPFQHVGWLHTTIQWRSFSVGFSTSQSPHLVGYVESMRIAMLLRRRRIFCSSGTHNLGCSYHPAKSVHLHFVATWTWLSRSLLMDLHNSLKAVWPLWNHDGSLLTERYGWARRIVHLFWKIYLFFGGTLHGDLTLSIRSEISSFSLIDGRETRLSSF